ncbi:hypothetical protein GOBAR_DD17483 [Gossypium barbadense]|nr:hypothetical protein GOBAR_DD17483 [Gossypium barbadense]
MNWTFSWLRANFYDLLSIGTENELMRTARAYILQLIEMDHVSENWREQNTNYLSQDDRGLRRREIPDHDYRQESQPMVKLDPKDQPPNTDTSPGQCVDAFGEGFQSNAYHPEMGDYNSTYQQPQSPIMFDMFGSTPIDDTMYSTPP